MPYPPPKWRLCTTWGSNALKKKADDNTKTFRIPLICNVPSSYEIPPSYDPPFPSSSKFPHCGELAGLTGKECHGFDGSGLIPLGIESAKEPAMESTPARKGMFHTHRLGGFHPFDQSLGGAGCGAVIFFGWRKKMANHGRARTKGQAPERFGEQPVGGHRRRETLCVVQERKPGMPGLQRNHSLAKGFVQLWKGYALLGFRNLSDPHQQAFDRGPDEKGKFLVACL